MDNDTQPATAAADPAGDGTVTQSHHHAHLGRAALTKVPQIIVLFWVSKILITAMGEATSDYMNQALGPAIAVPLMLIGLYLALRLQFRQDRYNAWTYWLVVVMVAIFGTSAADALHVGLGIPYVISTLFYAIVLTGVFIAWYRSEGTLSIHSIHSRRREKFYWATVLATFALGTAAGDLTATEWHMGFLPAGLMFCALIAVPAVAWWRFGLNSIVAFWFAYIITRPLGASFADWFDNTHQLTGLNLGAGPVALALAVVVAGFVAYLAITRVDVQTEDAGPSRGTNAVAPAGAGLPASEIAG
jgi:uncharacterized membrane-anchored protein